MDWNAFWTGMGNAVDILILVGAVVLAVERICNYFGKPIKFAKKKSEESLRKNIIEVLDEVLPKKLEEHDLETREKYKADRERYLQDIKSEVLTSIQNELGQVSSLSKQYDALVVSAKDVLREKIMQIYFKNKKDKTLTFHEKEALDQYYIDYKAIKGNSYIDRYYNRMCRWTVEDDDFEDEE